MNKLYYCLDCKRVFPLSHECHYCNSIRTKELRRNAPINVLGSKIKGRVFKINQEDIQILYIDEHKNQLIQKFSFEKIKKIL